jgi:hypothetical protein
MRTAAAGVAGNSRFTPRLTRRRPIRAERRPAGDEARRLRLSLKPDRRRPVSSGFSERGPVDAAAAHLGGAARASGALSLHATLVPTLGVVRRRTRRERC